MKCCSRKRVRLAGAIPSGIALVLLPKCPACIAAYLAAATGLSLSIGSASWLRTAILILCSGVVVVNVVSLLRTRLVFQRWQRWLNDRLTFVFALILHPRTAPGARR
jgi:hypothetical protein